jgi:hypothetical protein
MARMPEVMVGAAWEVARHTKPFLIIKFLLGESLGRNLLAIFVVVEKSALDTPGVGEFYAFGL